MGASYYEPIVICENGHSINSATLTSPSISAPFCKLCGAKAMHVCPHCKAQIRGIYVVPGVISSGRRYTPPRCCPQCGELYPWSEAKLAAAELADGLDQLDDEEKELLKRSLDDIIRDTPRAEVGALRFKRPMGKAGGNSAELFKEVLTGVLSETVVKILFAKAAIG